MAISNNVKKSLREIEYAMYYPSSLPEFALKAFLAKLGIKSAARRSGTYWDPTIGAEFTMESLDDMLTRVTNSSGKP